MKRVIWLFVLEEADWASLSGQLLRFVGKPPNNLLLVVAYAPEFAVLHNGPASLDSLRGVRRALEAPIARPRAWESDVQPVLAGFDGPLEVHCTYVGPVGPVGPRAGPHAASPKFTSFQHGPASTVAAVPTRYTLSIHTLHLPVEGFTLTAPYIIPRSQYFENGQLAQERRPFSAPGPRAFHYGSSTVALRSSLRQALDRGKPPPAHQIDVLGFIEPPAICCGSDPIMLRSSLQVFSSLCAAMSTLNKVALARLQTSTHISMAALRSDGSQMLLETLPFAEDYRCPQFPPLGPQPVGPWEQLIDNLPAANLSFESDQLLDEIYNEVARFL